VTNRRYVACVDAKICSPPNAPPGRYASPDVADLPVVNVTALQASQFCNWLGLRLPTELEWERAARGTDGRPWPWGTERPTSSLQANFIYADTQPLLSPVGRSLAGATPEGIYDLAGNVWEWTSSNYNLQSKDKDWTDIRQQPPDSLSVRGGGADSTPDALGNVAFRLSSSPFEPGPYIGFRCAVSR
jgi:formylglycine-generating enzyme required for sulfatase activity